VHVVRAWIGKSIPVIQKHNLQLPEEDFQRGAESGAATGRIGLQRFAIRAGSR
jgi:hypothetical protein